MKKILGLVFALFLTLGLSGCANSSSNVDTASAKKSCKMKDGSCKKCSCGTKCACDMKKKKSSCAHGKCGADMKKSCDMKKKRHSCGNGKCGSSMKKEMKKHSCGNGKCGK
jgi:uncharacterized low-complexity protein